MHPLLRFVLKPIKKQQLLDKPARNEDKARANKFILRCNLRV